METGAWQGDLSRAGIPGNRHRAPVDVESFVIQFLGVMGEKKIIVIIVIIMNDYIVLILIAMITPIIPVIPHTVLIYHHCPGFY